jgi:hypothetical protein
MLSIEMKFFSNTSDELIAENLTILTNYDDPYLG